MPTATATAYGEPWDAMEGGGTTSKGVKLGGVQKYVIAVNPAIIPYGSKLKIWPNPFGDRNIIFTAADTGGAFHSSNKIDFYIADTRHEGNHNRLFAWGSKTVQYAIVGHGSPTDVATAGNAQAVANQALTGGHVAGSALSDGGLFAGLGDQATHGLLYVALIGAGIVVAGLGAAHLAGVKSPIKDAAAAAVMVPK